MTWTEYVALWSKITAVPATFEHTTLDDHNRLASGGYGLEIGEVYGHARVRVLGARSICGVC